MAEETQVVTRRAGSTAQDMDLGATWGLLCSSFLGSILYTLMRKQVISKKELHRSLQVPHKPLQHLLVETSAPSFHLEATLVGCGIFMQIVYRPS